MGDRKEQPVNALAERLRAGKEAAKGDLIEWWCRNGRATAPDCDHTRRTNVMRPKEHYPSWGPR